MKTYQDLLALGDREAERIEFAFALVREHKGTAEYKTAEAAVEYDRRKNTTIMNYRKLLYDLSGKAIPDNYSANYKLPSGFFPRFVTQLNQYLLGNGMTLKDTKNKEKLGNGFDTKLQQIGRNALVQGVCFGFWNLDHIEVFKFTEFAPLYDEETGALMAGVRFWQLAADKPLRITLYEPDGFTEYIESESERMVRREKTPYVRLTSTTPADGEEIVGGMNYPGFPIIPLWGNPNHQSELVGLRESIDCYDLIKSGFANDLDEATSVYWLITNAGGMDAKDVANFIRQLKTLHGASVDGDSGVDVTAHTTQVPHEARKVYLEQLKADMYEDFQVVNVANLSAAAKTATEINAAYEPMNNKADQFEYCVLEFLDALFAIVGIDEEPTFTRSRIVNQTEETQMVISASEYLDAEAVLKKLPWLTQEEADEILRRRDADELSRAGLVTNPQQNPEGGEE